jgi:hypothetical protein
MSIFDDNISNDVSVTEKVRFAVEEVLDEAVDLVNNHFEMCKLNTVISGYYISIFPANTVKSFMRESNDKLQELCRSDFGRGCGLLITKPITLETISAEQTNKPNSTSTYKVNVHIDCFVDESTIPSTGAAEMYMDVDFFYTKTIYNQPHWL